MYMWGHRVWIGVGYPGSTVRNDILTPRHLLLLFVNPDVVIVLAVAVVVSISILPS